MRLAYVLFGLSLAVSAGCKKEPGSTAQTGSGSGSGSAVAPTVGSGSGSDTGSGSAGSGSGSGSDSGSAAGSGSDSGSAAAAGSGAGSDSALLGTHRAGNCPSMVLGATTTSALKGKTVIVTIESSDADAIAAIQKRTDDLLADKKAIAADGSAATGAGHNQKGGHGGGQGLCPVYVPDGATATAKHQPKGVVVTIAPKDKADALSHEVEARITKASAWVKANIQDASQGNQGGVGGGKGEDGSNHSGKGDGKGHLRKGSGGGAGTGGGGGAGTGGGSGKSS